MGEAALDAGVPVVDRAVVVRQDGCHLAVTGEHLQGTADAAVATRGTGTCGNRRISAERQSRLGERPGGTGVDTATAGDAVGVGPRPARTGSDHRIGAPTDQGEGERALDLGAHPHAPAAGDAQIPIEADVRVGVVAAPATAALGGLRRDPQRVTDPGQLAAAHAVAQSVGRQDGDDQLHRLAAQRSQIVGDDLDHRAVGGRGHAGGHHIPTGSHQAGTAGAHRSQTVVVAQGGQLDAGRAHRGEQRGTVGRPDGDTVDVDPHRSHPASLSP